MASIPDLNSYLQQQVSVRTISELRYEGQLYSYDPSSMTVTLKNVIAFGTENRNTATKIIPSKERHDFIVFDARHVVEFVGVKRTSDSSDPAILKMLDKSQNQRSERQKTSIVNLLQSSNGATRVRNVDIDHIMRKDGRSGNGANNRKQNSKSSKYDKRDRHVSFKVEKGGNKMEKRGQVGHIPHMPPSALSRMNDRRDNKKKEGRTSALLKPGEFAKPKKTKTFVEDFDFSKAFEGLELEPKTSTSEGDAKENAEPKEFYNMEKSFFDNLSSTAETEAQKRHRKDEKKVNKETFGEVSIWPRRSFPRRLRGPNSRRHGNRNATASAH